jgi:hypothetical protein
MYPPPWERRPPAPSAHDTTGTGSTHETRPHRAAARRAAPDATTRHTRVLIGTTRGHQPNARATRTHNPYGRVKRRDASSGLTALSLRPAQQVYSRHLRQSKAWTGIIVHRIKPSASDVEAGCTRQHRSTVYL